MNKHERIVPICFLLIAVAVSGCTSTSGNIGAGEGVRVSDVNASHAMGDNIKEFYMESSMSFGGQPFNRSGERRYANRSFDNAGQNPDSRVDGASFGNRSFERKVRPQFSVKEITVKKGDIVRIDINTTSGTHDFNIDEFNVHYPTPTGETTAVEFVADKSGEFVYYCSMPGHRESGQWGTLKVLDSG